LEELLIAITKGLVDNPEGVSIDVDEPNEEGVTVYHLHVAEGDMGRVIGKQGRIAKAIRVVDSEPGKISVHMAINMKYGYEIPKVSGMVQEKVKSAVETMTGLEVTAVDIRIATVAVAGNN
jgi:predicted RNA-binding protein YlqC (UPF0109 family)